MTNYINYLNHKLFDPSYYHRDYKHDIKEEKADNTIQEAFKRVLNISLPFLSLYRPLGNKISISMGTYRVISSMQSLDSAKDALPQLTETALAITSLSATLFNFRLGSLLTTSSDIFINLKELKGTLSKQEYEKALSLFLRSANNALYLGIMLTGSLEIVLASFLVQALVNFYESREEWTQSKYPEVLAKIAMGFIRLNQADGQLALIQRRNFLFQLKEFQELRRRISNGRETEHFLDHPLADLMRSIDDQRVTFTDSDGNEYNFGSHYHGSGGNAVKGMNVSFKKTEDGTRINFKVNHVFRENLQKVIDETKGLSEGEVGEFFQIMGSHAKGIKCSHTTLNFDDHGVVGDAYKITLKGIGSIFIGSDPSLINMYDQIVVQMDKGANIYDLHELLSFLDLDIALKQSLFEDVERTKIGQLFRLFFPEDATLFERTEEFFTLSLEELKMHIFSLQPKMEEYLTKYLSKMELREILPGRMRFYISGLADDLRKLGAIGLTTAITGAYSKEELFKRVFTVLEMGMLSSETRKGNGLSKTGLSSSMDLYTGGSDSVFTQLVTDTLIDDGKTFSDFYYHSKIRFCFSPEALESFTYQYHDDSFGTRNVDDWSWWSWGDKYLKRPNIFSFVQEERRSFNFDNEVMIKERIDPSFITSIVVDNDQTRDELMVYLRKKEMVEKDINGIDTILGIPWDQFIHVGSKIKEELFSKA